MIGVQVDSPWSAPPVYVVRNTFVEVDEHGEQMTEEPSVPAFRRRRGSSFFRNSSEPLTVGGRLGRRTSGGRARTTCDEMPCDFSTEDEETDPGLSTPEISPATSRAASPAPGSRSPMYANITQLPKLEQHCQQMPQTVFAAALHAGFNAGLWTAMSQQQQQQQHPYCTQGANVGQRSLCFEPHKTLLAFPPAGQARPLVREPSPFEQHSSNSSDAGTVAKAAHLIWCDHRAFKDTSSTLKQQLESRCGASCKTHKTAENCIRLFRKKQRAQGRPPCVILVSWANAPGLLQYLSEATHVSTKVVVLCDARSCRKNESAEQMAAQFPFIHKIETTWEAAVESVSQALADFQ